MKYIHQRCLDQWRAQALFYRETVDFLRQTQVEYKNTAPRYNTLSLRLNSPSCPIRTSRRAWKVGSYTIAAGSWSCPPARANPRSDSWPSSALSAAPWW